MNSFSINRFGKTLRWVLCTNFRSLLMWTIGAALVVFMCEMAYWKLATSHNSPFTMLENFGEVGTVLFVIASMVLISSVVACINDKRKRESFMMLPSTNAEKYLSLIVYSTVVCILCVFLAMVLGDTLRMAFLWGRDLMGFPVSHQGESYSVYVGNHWWSGMYADCWVRWFDSALPMLIYNLLPDYEYGWSWYGIVNWVFYIICMVWIHSLYTLSGTLMRKYAFVAASLVFIILFVSFAKFVRYYDLELFRSDWTEAGVYYNSQIGTVIYVLCAVLPLISIANYWISFRIFKGFELITNKWFNYDFHK